MRGVIILCCLALAYAKVSYKGYKGLSVKTPDAASVAIVNALKHLGVKLLLEPNTKQESEIVVPPQVYEKVAEKLEAASINFTKIYDDLQEKVDLQMNANKININLAQFRSRGKHDFTIVSYFPTYKQAEDWMYGLQRDYPTLAEVKRIGQSYENNTQVAIKVGSAGSNKQVIWIDGAIHAREWATVPTVLYLATKLLADYDSKRSEKSTKALLDKYDFYFLPIFNPDGYIHTHEQDRFWRKNRRPNGYGCYGTDLNRNFGHHWGESGVSRDQCDDSYLGPYPFSEIESKNVRDTLLGFKGRFQMYMNMHAYGQLLFYPWGFNNNADFQKVEEHKRIAEAAQTAIFNANDRHRRYQIGKPGEVLYNAAGGVFDWAYAEAGAKFAFAAELSPSFYRGVGLGGFEVSPNDMPAIAEEVYRGVKAAVEAM